MCNARRAAQGASGPPVTRGSPWALPVAGARRGWIVVSPCHKRGGRGDGCRASSAMGGAPGHGVHPQAGVGVGDEPGGASVGPLALALGPV